MAIRISELTSLSADLAQSDALPIVDLSAAETKQVSVADLIVVGISGAPSGFIDLSKLDQNSTIKLGASVLDLTGVASGTYGAADTVAQFVVNGQGLITTATGIPIVITASSVTGLAAVATSGTYASLTGQPVLGTLSAQDADSVSISGGTISGVTLISGDVTISGGIISGITDLAIADGGTGASTASGARTNLGLVVGSDVQAYSAILSGVAAQFTAADEIIYASASGIIASTPFTSLARSIVSGATAGEVRSTIGLGSIATQDAGSVAISGGTISNVAFNSASVTISGGTISGIADIAIEDGGTGASDAETARTNLGVAIGTDVQAYSSVLSDIAAQFDEADEIVYASASGVISATPFTSFARSIVSGSTDAEVRSTLGLGSVSVQDAGSVAISGGTISDVSLSSSNVNIGGGVISGITDLAIEDGGTGASTASGARANLGLAIGSDIQGYSAILSGVASQFGAADQIIYSSASGIVASTPFTSLARSIASGSTTADVRATLELGSIATQDAGSVVISGGTISGVTITSSSVTIDGGTISGITDLTIEDGGTGASDAATARTNLGLAIGADVQAYSPVLSGIAAQFDEADEIVYASASGVVSATPFTSIGRDIVGQSAASGVRTVIGLGSIATQDVGSVVISGGTISDVVFNSASVTISGGTISGITDLTVEDGGTGASDAATARTNLGLAIGIDVQAYSQVLADIANEFNEADEIVYASASGVISATPFTSVGRDLVGQTTASGVRDVIGFGSIALQNANSVFIGGGTISGITDLAVEDGGTGASTASGARANLGLAIGSDVQAYDAGLASIAGLTTGADQLIYTTAADTYATTNITAYSRGLLASGNSAQDARTVLGLGSLSTKSLVASGDVASGAIFGTAIAPDSIIAGSYRSLSIATDDIQDGAITSVKIIDSGITEAKIADNTTTIVGNGAPVFIGAFIGQRYFDNINKLDYTWDGSAWERGAGIASISFTESTPISFVVNYPDNVSADIDVSFENQAANTFLGGPVSGVGASPSFRAIEPADLPIATTSGVGAVFPGAGLQVATNGSIGHSNAAIAGTYAGPITIDSEGHIISAQISLSADNIPELDASKITTGTFSSDFLAPNSVTANQLADYGIAQVSESAPTPEFAGQWWINPNDRSAYIWVGEVTPAPNGYWLNLGYGSPTQINLRFGGTYNASGNIVESINSYGIEAGLTIGQALSAPNTSNNGIYLICTSSGVGTAPAPVEALSIGNWVLSQGVGATWTKVALSSAVAGVGDQDVLVDGATLVPVASGVASQEDLNEILWGRAQIATGSTAGIVRASSEIVVASGTGIMTIGVTDDGLY